jgi:hypothetical protein
MALFWSRLLPNKEWADLVAEWVGCVESRAEALCHSKGSLMCIGLFICIYWSTIRFLRAFPEESMGICEIYLLNNGNSWIFECYSMTQR